MLLRGSLLLLLLSLASVSVESSGPKHDRRVVCYMALWGVYLSGNGKFDVPDATPALHMCTHVIYVFLGLDGREFTIRSLDPYRDFPDNFGLAGIPKAVKLKAKFPHLKVMVGMGGWNEGSINYSNMVSTKNRRTAFIDSALAFLKENKLDGLEINWQFPGDRGGSPADKSNFVALVREMREQFDKHGYIISLALSSFPYRISLGIDALHLSKHAHFINVLAYEYHGFWEKKVGIGTPLVGDDDLNIQSSIGLYRRLGVPPEKINLGLSNYGMTFYLNEATNDTSNVIGRPAKDFGFKGPFHAADGFMGYNEICLELKNPEWKQEWHEQSSTPYAVKGDRVISYDNPTSLAEKVKYAMESKLGGVMYYGLEKDDFRNDCGGPNDPKFPLLNAIDKALVEYSQFIYSDLLALFEKYNAHYFWNGMKDHE